MSDPLPTYDWQEPARLQEHDWDCSVESIEWCCYSWGLPVDDNRLEDAMIAEGIVDPDIGCLDASGASLARFVNEHLGAAGFWASNEPSVTFDDVATEAATRKHPIAIGGRGWYHWSGCRGFADGVLLLANPAPGWKNVYQTMSRAQWDALGPWSMVRVQHPAAEEGETVPEPPAIDYTPWTDGGKVGSGLLELMAQDGTYPAQRWSTWLPLGTMPADIEECIGVNGITYRWLLGTSQGYRIRPS